MDAHLTNLESTQMSSYTNDASGHYDAGRISKAKNPVSSCSCGTNGTRHGEATVRAMLV